MALKRWMIPLALTATVLTSATESPAQFLNATCGEVMAMDENRGELAIDFFLDGFMYGFQEAGRVSGDSVPSWFDATPFIVWKSKLEAVCDSMPEIPFIEAMHRVVESVVARHEESN